MDNKYVYYHSIRGTLGQHILWPAIDSPQDHTSLRYGTTSPILVPRYQATHCSRTQESVLLKRAWTMSLVLNLDGISYDRIH